MKLGALEIAVILGLALIIFGPSKLPELGKTLGQTINEFKNQLNNTSEKTEDDSDEKKES